MGVEWKVNDIITRMEKLVQKAFSDSSTKTFHIVQDLLALLTIVSIVALVLETVQLCLDIVRYF